MVYAYAQMNKYAKSVSNRALDKSELKREKKYK